jgi:hypothetical protein
VVSDLIDPSSKVIILSCIKGIATSSLPKYLQVVSFYHLIKTPHLFIMKYSFVLAGLAASAIATPYVDIVVGEEGATTSHHNHHHHEHNRNHGGWFSSLLGRSRSHSRGNVSSPPHEMRSIVYLQLPSADTTTMTTAVTTLWVLKMMTI